MNKAILKITNEALARVLKLDQDILITSITLDMNRDITEIALKTVNDDKLYKVAEGAGIPVATLEEVTQDDYLYTIKSSMLSYSAALKALKEGKCVSRSIWRGYWKLETIEGLDKPTIVAYLKGDGMRVTATAYQEDMLAEDWYIVEPKNKVVCAEPKVELKDFHKEIPYHAKELLVEIFGNSNDVVLFQDVEKLDRFGPRTFNYLLSRRLVEIPAFAEGQAECVRLTEIGVRALELFKHIVASCL